MALRSLLLKTILGVALPGFFLPPLAADDLTTQDGRTYKNYKVQGQDKDGVTITYTDSATVPFDQLPPDLQRKLGHDPDALTAEDQAIKARQAAATAAQGKLEVKLDAQDQDLKASLDPAKTPAAASYAKAQKTTILGQIFIAEQGGETVDFSGVHVGLIPLDLLNKILPEKQDRVTQELQLLDPILQQAQQDEVNLRKKRDAALGTGTFASAQARESEMLEQLGTMQDHHDYFSGGQYYFEELQPWFVADAVPDANGKFTILAPATGDFALVTAIHSEAGNAIKKYFWFVKVHPASISNTYILLDSENQSSTQSADSLVKTDSSGMQTR